MGSNLESNCTGRLEQFRATGAGWQTRIKDAPRRAAKLYKEGIKRDKR
jgi:hypothetical protein